MTPFQTLVSAVLARDTPRANRIARQIAKTSSLPANHWFTMAVRVAKQRKELAR